MLNSKSASPIPAPIEQLQRQLDEFRSTQLHRTKLRRRCGRMRWSWPGNTVCIRSLIRCDWTITGLKKRLDGVPDSQKKATKPAFVELVAAQPRL
jgi:hypothetical protein